MAFISLRSSLRVLWTATVTLVFLTSSIAAPTFDNVDNAIMYLAQYGYLSTSVRNPSSAHLVDEGTWKRAITEFQSFAGLNATGELDVETAKVMSMPRCGVRDKVGSSGSRAKRYALQGSVWSNKHLTYKISKYPSWLHSTYVDEELARAFLVWSDYTDLTFTQKKFGNVHIDIRFEQGAHGDVDPFDGPGGILGHAFHPGAGGYTHFDDAEMWTINSWTGFNLFQVAAHEFGHALGLAHSSVPSALMAPFYREYIPAFQLHQDDINGIQALYPPLCSDPKFDTIFNTVDGNTFIFKGKHYWRLTQDGVASGYPRLISRDWPGLPGNIDTAFTYSNGKTYFFKGSKYWSYNGQTVDGDYPQEISKGFPGLPNNLHAALVWSGDGKIYFYKGSKSWRFDPSQTLSPLSNPAPVSYWKGIPDGIDAALQYTNGYTYFFKGGSYWRFNDRTFSVDSTIPAFPRPTAYWWLGCSSAPRSTVAGAAPRSFSFRR